MKSLFGFLLGPALGFAIELHPVSSPRDFLDENLPLLDGAVLSDSTWVVSDSENTLWCSRDHGANWESIPLDPQGADGEILGVALVSSDRMSTWTYRGGWLPMTVPAGFASTDDSYFGPRGDRGFLDDLDGRIRYYRSTDGLRTWTEWFSMDSALVPPGAGRFGERQLGRIWYLVADSGYVRGTGNGVNWTKSVLPKGFEPVAIEPDEADTVLQLLGFDSTNYVLARSRDLGATWKILSMALPGISTRRLSPNLWTSTSFVDPQSSGEHWISHAPNGPWTKLDTTGINGIFSALGWVLLATSTGIWAVDLPYASLAPRAFVPFHSVRRVGSHLEVMAAGESAGIPWSLVDVGGSRIGSGTLRKGLNVLACPGTTAWLRLGRTTFAIAPLGGR
jgi:hypothetical protein